MPSGGVAREPHARIHQQRAEPRLTVAWGGRLPLPIRTAQQALLNSPRPGQYFPITTPTPAPGICSQAMKVVHIRHPTYCNDPIRHATASTHNVTASNTSLTLPPPSTPPPPHPTHTQNISTYVNPQGTLDHNVTGSTRLSQK